MRVIGIDPGYGRCGIAILEKEGGRERVLYSTCVETSAKHPFPQRLAQVANECADLIAKHRPDALAIERLYFSSNQKTAMQVAEVRGAIVYVAERAQVSIHEYTPAQIKSASTGWGRSDKQNVAHMLRVLLHIDKDIEHDDEYDAIAVGLTCLTSTRTHV